MGLLRFIRVGPIARLSMGLISLLMTMMLLSDLFLGIIPRADEAVSRNRQKAAELLSIQLSGLMNKGDDALLGRLLQQVLTQDAEIRTVTIRRSDGSTWIQRGDPVAVMGPMGGESDSEHMRVSLRDGPELTGEIDIRFTPRPPEGLLDMLKRPGAQLLTILSLGGTLLSYIYLRRALHYLNPSASVPDRVRKAFDSLPIGLLIVDQQLRVVLANDSFRRMHPSADAPMNGKVITSLEWLLADMEPEQIEKSPWILALKDGKAIEEARLQLPQADGSVTQLLVSCSPITDGNKRGRGSMVTFDDVTEVHRTNEDLRVTLTALEQSRIRIEEQNEELRRLASRDSLTGCYNRRAFFDLAGESFAQAKGSHASLCVLMADIDHFKQFNDLYGHAVGDQVIKVVARALGGGLRQPDLLCRYGGEEFCIAFPNTSMDDALGVAERIRAYIEAHANDGLRDIDVKPITTSFGVACVLQGAANLEELIDQADQALYLAKQNGRNRVMAWSRNTQA